MSRATQRRKATALQKKIVALKRAEPWLSARQISERLNCSQSAVYRLLNPERYARYREQQSAESRRNSHRKHHLKAKYGITEDEYAAIYEVQGGRCALCRRARGTGKRRLAVDHDHKVAGKRESIRGLLCSPCNNFLAHARDEVEFFARVTDYLAAPPARKVLDAA